MKSDAFVDEPFKNLDQVKAEIRYCARAGGVVTLLSFLLIALGIISDALNITLVLEPMSWFLLALIVMVGSMGPTLHVVVAKHLLSIEAESKKEQ
jgi:hypothetical protein